MVNKSIKKLVLIALLVAIPAQTMPFSLPSFSSIKNSASQFFSTMKETIKNHKTAITVAVGSCIATCACALGFKNKKTTTKVALGGFIATGLSKVYSDWRETRKQEQEKIRKQDEELDAALAEKARIEQEDAKLDAALAEKARLEEERRENARLDAVQAALEEDARVEAALALEGKMKKEKQNRYYAEEQLARDLEESLFRIRQTLEIKKQIEWLKRANNRINGRPLLYQSKRAVVQEEKIAKENNAPKIANQKVTKFEKQLKKIEQFLEVDPDEIHEADICLEKLDELLEGLKKLLKIDLKEISINLAKIKNIEQRVLVIIEKMEALREHCFSGVTFNSFESADDIEQYYQRNFDAVPLKDVGTTFEKFMANKGLYGFLGFDEIPSNKVSYAAIKDAFQRKREKVDTNAKREGHNDLTPEQKLCRQIDYLIRNEFCEKNARDVHRDFQFSANRLPDQKTREMRQENYLLNINNLQNCKEKALDIKSIIKKLQLNNKSVRAKEEN